MKKSIRNAFALVAFLVLPQSAEAVVEEVVRGEALRVFIARKIITMDPALPAASAVAGS